jgi:DNA polymerase eta
MYSLHAQLCSAWKKPNAQTILRNDAVSAFLRPLKFKKVRP